MTLTIGGRLAGPVFLELLEVLVSKASTAGLVASTFELEKPSEATASLLADLDPYLLKRDETRGWPGSQVPGWAEPLMRLTFRYDREVARVLFADCPALLAWQERALPYDLHLTDTSGNTVLGSITSEDDAWVEMSRAEWSALVQGTRLLKDVRLREDRRS